MNVDKAASWVADGALTRADTRWAVMAPTKREAELLLERLTFLIPETMIARIRWSWPAQIDLNNGSTIKALSGDPRSSNRGYSLDGIWLHRISSGSDSYREIMPALISRGGSFVRSF